MTRFIIAAAISLTVASSAYANNSNVYVDGSSVYVRYQDLDLQSADGRSQLQKRIQRGAGIACTAPGIGATSVLRQQCYRTAHASAVEQMNQIVRR